MQQPVTVNDQRSVSGIDARARVGRLDQTAQNWGNAFRPDRQFQRGKAVVAEGNAGVCRFGEFCRIDCQTFGFDLGVAGDRRGDNLSLDAQRFALGVDQPAARTRNVENADAEYEKSDQVR
jgi:hypothetical protein